MFLQPAIIFSTRCGINAPTKGIPLAFPNSADATDNYVYVADMVNLRLLRLKKIFEAIALSRRNL